MAFNKLERKILKEASFFDRAFEAIVQTLYRGKAKKMFKQVADDIDTDPKMAAAFQQFVDSKKQYEKWKKEMETAYPDLKGKL